MDSFIGDEMHDAPRICEQIEDPATLLILLPHSNMYTAGRG